MIDRRKFITSTMIANTAAVAGCTQIINSESDRGPNDTVEQYYTATSDEDIDRVNELLHPDDPQYPAEEHDLVSGDVEEIEAEETSIREGIERSVKHQGLSDEITDEEIEEQVENVEQETENLINEIGADDYSYIYVTIDDEREVVEFVIQDDGKWLVHSLGSPR